MTSEDSATTETTTSTELPVEIEEDRERTRRLIIILAFLQFNLFVFAALGSMVFKGWEVSPATSNYMTMVLQAEIALLSSGAAFYMLMSKGQTTTRPVAVPPTIAVTPAPNATTTTTTTTEPKP